ncbi:MAG: urea carboxylase, partial [Bryobacterales bacterium]|nr:urea carboxylase [Bryobacterales bacterium]
MPTLTESTLKTEDAVYKCVVFAGDYWIHEIGAGQTFRIIDLGGNQAVDTLFYNAVDTSERYSATDTIVAQRNT